MKLRRILALLLALCMLAGCTNTPDPTPSDIPSPDTVSEEPSPSAEQSEEPSIDPDDEPFRFTRANFPILNGSTSTVPLGEAIASVLLGETREEVSNLINFSKTTESYRYLMWGWSDLLIAAEPADVIWQEKEEQGFQWEMEPFAVDGLVFVVNSDNPIDSLTTEQIQKIYTGEITNWSEVGGEDMEIIPFQRNAEAGSQTAMRNLVMKDLPMMEAPTDYVQTSMGALIEAVSAYNGSPAAIGYTVYYYANDMKMAEGLKIISVNGVEPNADTIRSGEYPFRNNYYAVVPTWREGDTPAKILYRWLLSEEGQRLVENEGYVAVHDPAYADASLSVYTDWSKLDGYDTKTAKYTYSDHYCGSGNLEAWDGYGTLMPYVGADLSFDNYIENHIPILGLMTELGEIVTDAVYSNIVIREGGFLLLYRGTRDILDEYGSDDSGRQYFSRTIAAPDGSWVLNSEGYDLTVLTGADLLALIEGDDLVFLNTAGKADLSVPTANFENYFGENFQWNYSISVYEGLGYLTFYDYTEDEWFNNPRYLYMDLSNGKVMETPPSGYPSEPVDIYTEEPPEFPGYEYAAPTTDPVTGITYYLARREGSISDNILDADGNVLWEDYEGLYFISNEVINGMVASWPERWSDHSKPSYFEWYDLHTGECVFRYPLPSNSD